MINQAQNYDVHFLSSSDRLACTIVQDHRSDFVVLHQAADAVEVGRKRAHAQLRLIISWLGKFRPRNQGTL